MAFMSPGSVTEKLHFFVAEYQPSMRVGDGGGLPEEGRGDEVLEVLGIDEALGDGGRQAASPMPNRHAAVSREAAPVPGGVSLAPGYWPSMPAVTVARLPVSPSSLRALDALSFAPLSSRWPPLSRPGTAAAGRGSTLPLARAKVPRDAVTMRR